MSVPRDDAPPRVLLACGWALERAVLGSALAGEPSIGEVNAAPDGRQAVNEVRRLRPDVAVLGVDLPVIGGLEACTRVKSSTDTRVLLISDTAETAHLRAALEGGADGYLVTDSGQEGDLDAFVDAVHRVNCGQAVVPAGMLGDLLRGLIERNREAERAFARFMRLTTREREVLELLTEGCGPQTAAEILTISPETARTHVQHVLEKLEVHSQLEAATLAAEHGFFDRLPSGGA